MTEQASLREQNIRPSVEQDRSRPLPACQPDQGNCCPGCWGLEAFAVSRDRVGYGVGERARGMDRSRRLCLRRQPLRRGHAQWV